MDLTDYDCIIRAEREVVLATNYWQPSNSVNKISSGLMELSKRVGERKQKNKIVVKIMWDRGQLSQLVDNHAHVTLEGMEALDLPRPDEIPNLELEVIVSSSCSLNTSTCFIDAILLLSCAEFPQAIGCEYGIPCHFRS